MSVRVASRADPVLGFCAASAAVHSSTRIMLAALKFFLGQDEEAAADSDDDEDEEAPKLVQPSKADVYKATKKVHNQIADTDFSQCPPVWQVCSYL